MNKPLITVITVVYNAKPTLEATILSVLQQPKDLYEYWIIDGGSSDGSQEVIRRYESQLAGWVCEPDRGIYDAMNKGINKAKGDWIYFLGGDDILRPNIFDEIQKFLCANKMIIFGKIRFDNGYIMRSYVGTRTILQNTIHHQSAFYNATVFTNYRYDISLRIVSEYDLHLQMYLSNSSMEYVPKIIADCATGGASSQLSLSLRETNLVRSKYIRFKLKRHILSFILGLYYLQKRIRYFLYGHRV